MLSAAGAVGVALVLAACGSSAKKASTGASSTTAASSSTTSQAPSSNTGVISTASSSKGEILIDAQGKSLYVFDHDAAGKIACTTGCVAVWPPLVVPNGSSAPTGVSGVTATLGTVMRPEGTTQLTSDGRPLYAFANDSAPGQTNGDGFMGIWHVAKASGNGSPPAAGGSTATTAPTSSSSSGGYGY
jgi:predicted lipoprotein with Yx(FWY)xxD motif